MILMAHKLKLKLEYIDYVMNFKFSTFSTF